MQGQPFCWCWVRCTVLSNSMQCSVADAQGQPWMIGCCAGADGAVGPTKCPGSTTGTSFTPVW